MICAIKKKFKNQLDMTSCDSQSLLTLGAPWAATELPLSKLHWPGWAVASHPAVCLQEWGESALFRGGTPELFTGPSPWQMLVK